MNNRVKPHELGADKLAHALNVQFTNEAELVIPGQEFAVAYSVGSCNSVNNSANGILYASGTTLYKYAATPVSLKTSVGSNAFSFTRPIGNTVYFSNGSVTGRYVKGESSAREWGTPTPSSPTVSAITTGGMTGGDYRVAITWIAGEESGAGNSVQVTVPEGGGIRLSAFPTAPSYVTKIGVYCSQLNGKDLYLYNEYAIATTTVDIADFKGTIVLDTQFAAPPSPPVNAPLIDHYGRIYYGSGAYLYYTEAQRYGLQRPFNFFPFDSEVQTVVSCPGVLYVGTLYKLYKVFNIDGDGPAMVEQLQDCASVKGSECYDPDGVSAYFMSHRGFIKATPEGLTELSYNDVAIPFYTAGSMTVTEYDGLKYLLFSGTTGTANPLALKAWNDAETFPQSSGWALNLTTGAVSKYDFSAFNRLHNGYASGSSGLSSIGPGSVSVSTAKTGRYDLGDSHKKRTPKLYAESEGDRLTLNLTTENSSVDYTVDATTGRETVPVKLARGQKGRYWQFTLSNATGNSAVVSELELVPMTTPRHK